MTFNTSTTSRAKYLAREVLISQGIEHPADVSIDDIAYALGVDGIMGTNLQGAEGRILAHKEKFLISYSNSIRNDGKRRFVKAHELGHFVLHQGVLLKEKVHVDKKVSMNDSRGMELEANAFAGELLMPARLLISTYFTDVPSMTTLDEMASSYRVSRLAAIMRYCEIGEASIGIISSTGKRINWCKSSKDFPFATGPKGSPVHRSTLAAVFHDGMKPSCSRKKVLGEHWYSQLKGSGVELMEQSYQMTRNEVITMIWAQS